MTFRAAAPAGAALALALAAPAAASAATVAPTSACVRYADAQSVPTLGLHTEGWAPQTALTFKVAGKPVGSGTTDAGGAFATGPSLFTPPAPRGNIQTMTLTAEDGAGRVAAAPVRIVRLGIAVPGQARPSQRVRYRVFGFHPGKKLYLFVRRGGRVKGRFTLGRPRGACGTLVKRMRYMPLKSWRSGRYEYWAATARRFSVQTAVPVFTISITR